MSKGESVTYVLVYPIEIKATDGKVLESYTSFELRRPKGKHLKATDRIAGEAAKTLALIASCVGVPAEFLDDLDIVDFTALGEIVEGFSKAPRPITETSSAT
jgi:hypothetical protein